MLSGWPPPKDGSKVCNITGTNLFISHCKDEYRFLLVIVHVIIFCPEIKINSLLCYYIVIKIFAYLDREKEN